MRDHWESLHARAQAEVARADAGSREARWRRRRAHLVRGVVATLVVGLAATTFVLLSGRAPTALRLAADSVHTQFTAPVRPAGFDPLQALIALDRFAGDLERSGLARAELPGAAAVVQAVREVVDHAGRVARRHVDLHAFATDLPRLHGAFAAARARFAPGDREEARALEAALTRFGAAAETSAVLLAMLACRDDSEREVVRRYAEGRRLEVGF
jgi:hypothetical protein